MPSYEKNKYFTMKSMKAMKKKRKQKKEIFNYPFQDQSIVSQTV